MGLSPDDPVWDPTSFTKNRDRLQIGDVFAKFMSKLLNHPQVKGDYPPHGTLMSVSPHPGDTKQVYIAARYGEVFGTQDGGETWASMPLPGPVKDIYSIACG